MDGVVVQTAAVGVLVVSSGSAGVSFCSEGWWGLRKGVLLWGWDRLSLYKYYNRPKIKM